MADVRLGRSIVNPDDGGVSEVTQLLMDWNNGDPDALDKLMPLVFHTLHQIAQHRFINERPSHTLQPTALISELYVRFMGEARTDWKNRAHFFGAVSEMMRRILLDNARKFRAAKRGRDKLAVPETPLEELSDPTKMDADTLLAVDKAMMRLKEMDEKQYRIVKLRFFAGLSTAEIAQVLEIGERTVKREWASARAWLFRELR